MSSKLQELYQYFYKHLEAKYSPRQIEYFWRTWKEDVYDTSEDLQQSPQHAQSQIDKLIQAMLSDYPIEYYTGYTFFRGMKLKIDERALIPRPETEELVEYAIQHIANHFGKDQSLRILDIGTGSGCIALALKSAFPNASVYAVDVDEDALSLAAENASLYDLAIRCIADDICAPRSNTLRAMQWDVLISNPPYVLRSEIREMSSSAVRYEPPKALFVREDNPLYFYRCIERYAQRHLQPNGLLFLECSAFHADKVNAYFTERRWATKLIDDLAGKPRILLCHKNNAESPTSIG